MSLSLMLQTVQQYLLVMWNFATSKLILVIFPVSFLIEIYPGGQEIAMNLLVFSYLADTVLGISLAINNRQFDMKKLPKLLYKVIVFYVTLKISQLTGQMMDFYHLEVIGKVLFPLTLLVWSLVEATSALFNANELFPNKITQTLVNLLNKLSENALEKIKGLSEEKPGGTV